MNSLSALDVFSTPEVRAPAFGGEGATRLAALRLPRAPRRRKPTPPLHFAQNTVDNARLQGLSDLAHLCVLEGY